MTHYSRYTAQSKLAPTSDPTHPHSIEFRSGRCLVAWARAVDDECPGLLGRLVVTRPRSGAVVVWLSRRDGGHLTEDGRDALIHAALRVRQQGRRS